MTAGRPVDGSNGDDGAPSPSAPATSSVDRAFRILSAFTNKKPLMSLSELSRATELPKTTVLRFVRELMAAGALEQIDGRYGVGLGLFETGSLYRGSQLREQLLPVIEDLFHLTKETVHLAILNGVEVVYIDKISGQRSVDSPSRPGGRMPAYCTGVGKVLLAHAPSEQVARVVEVGLTPRTSTTITSAPQLNGELERIRNLGYAVDREETSVGMTCAAAPVFGRSDVPVCAISVTGPIERIDPQQIAPTVQAFAHAASRELRRLPALGYLVPR